MIKRRTAKEIFKEAMIETAKTVPIDKITVKMLVEKSGLSLQTFYNHFRDKQDLVLYIHKAEGDNLLKRLEEGESFRELTLANIRFYRRHRDFMHNALLNTHGMDSYVIRSSLNAYESLKKYILKRFSLDELDEERDLLLKAYCFSCTFMYAEWAFSMKDVSEETFAGYVEDMMPEKLREYLI